MSDEDGVFGLQFICSVKMMSINWGAFSINQIYWVNFEPEHTHLALLSCEIVEECELLFISNPDVASAATNVTLSHFKKRLL